MRIGGGHAKGSEFERKIAKDVVKAFAHFGIVQRDCWRSVLSGGHAMSSGDLVISEKLLALFPYSVECKFRKEIHWENFLLRNEKSEEMKWVTQVLEGVEKRPELRPLLVMKANRQKVLVARTVQLRTLATWTSSDYLFWVFQPWTEFLKDAVLEATKHA